MSYDQQLQNEMDNRSEVFITCPDCGTWLWDEVSQEFSKICVCGWTDPKLPPELSERKQAALGFLQFLIERTENGEQLTSIELQILELAAQVAL